MITNTQKSNLIERCFGRYALSSNHKNISVVCPFCLSKGKITKKKKLSIDIETGVYHCWVCESKGRNIGAVALKFCDNKELSTSLCNAFGGLSKKDESEIEEEKTVALPASFKIINNLSNQDRIRYKQHINYLKARGVGEEDISRFCIGVCDEFEYSNYVIFPSLDENGQVNYFVARNTDTGSYRRYRNCEISRKDVIFRHFNVDFTKKLILVEGVFDLINCPENSTCLLGSWLDENYLLFREIVKHKTPVVLCLDNDATGKAMKIAKKLRSYCVDVEVLENTGQDFGDLDKESVLNLISDSKQYDFADRVRYLINNISSGSMF